MSSAQWLASQSQLGLIWPRLTEWRDSQHSALVVMSRPYYPPPGFHFPCQTCLLNHIRTGQKQCAACLSSSQLINASMIRSRQCLTSCRNILPWNSDDAAATSLKVIATTAFVKWKRHRDKIRITKVKTHSCCCYIITIMIIINITRPQAWKLN